MIRHFLGHFSWMNWKLRAVYLVLLGLILGGALVIARVEGVPAAEAIYFSFITGLTIGYGDIVPHSVTGRIVSVLLGFIGILFTGLVVAVTVRAVHEAWEDAHGAD